MIHDDDDDGQQVVVAGPVWEWDWLEVPAIGLRIVAGCARCVGMGLDALALELQAAAECRRQVRQQDRERWEQDVARADMAGTLEGMILFEEGGAP